MKKELSDEDIEFYSIENHISEKTAPAFIMHTSNDQVVDIRNSLILAEKMAENKLEFELHIYPDAPHGAALGNEITSCGNDKWCNKAISSWIDQAVEWTKNLK
jgi:dipeptidyl aminopeptidase/acylaminoacyl peptidase